MRRLLLLAPLFLTAVPTPADGETYLTDAKLVSGFDWYGANFVWWNGSGACDTEFPNTATIRIRSMANPAVAKKLLVESCEILEGPHDNVVLDGTYVYFFGGGKLLRKARVASASTPPQPVPGGPSKIPSSDSDLVALASGVLYWASQISTQGTIEVWTMPADSSAPAKLLHTVTSTSEPVKFAHVEYTTSKGPVGALLLLTLDGVLLRLDASVGGPQKTLATNVADFAAYVSDGVGTFVLAATGGTAAASGKWSEGSLVRIGLASLTTEVLYKPKTGTGAQVIGVATEQSDGTFSLSGASTDLFVVQAPISCDMGCSTGTPSVFRSPLAATTTSWQLFETPAGANLRSDGKFVYWSAGKTIQRKPVDAPPVTLDLTMDALEVTQVIQNLESSVKLVAGKATFVRGYGHTAEDTTGSSGTWNPSYLLEGVINGTTAKGSPLGPSTWARGDLSHVTDMAKLRPSLKKSVLFELPSFWTAAGDLKLTLKVNADIGLPETGSAPNAISRTVHFEPTLSPCMVFVHFDVEGLAYPRVPTSTVADLPSVLRRFTAMYPVAGVKSFVLPTIDLRLPPQEELDEAGLTMTDVSLAGDVMQLLSASNFPGCAVTHWIGLVNPMVNDYLHFQCGKDEEGKDRPDEYRCFPLGVAYKGTTAQLLLVIPTCPGFPSRDWACPQIGLSITHESGHNYGLSHVECADPSYGTPPGPYQDYPYPPCDLGPVDDPTAFYGFDSVTRKVIAPKAPVHDIMTYGDAQWMSDYTYGILFQQMANLYAYAAQLGPSLEVSGPGTLLAARGTVGLDDSVTLAPFYVLDPAIAPPHPVSTSLAAAGVTVPKGEYSMRLVGGDGQALATYPIAVEAPSVIPEGPIQGLAFDELVAFDAGTASIEVLHGAKVIASRAVSSGAPSVHVEGVDLTTLPGQVTLSWSASDPDGDLLYFMPEASIDGGTTWRPLACDVMVHSQRYPASSLGGGPSMKLRVIATDGANTAWDDSETFALPDPPPDVRLSGVAEGARVPYGQVLELSGLATTPLEGSLSAEQLTWDVTGPTHVAATDRDLVLRELPPGLYTATLAARSATDAVATVKRSFEVTQVAVPDGEVPVLDGACFDAGYEEAAQASVPLGGVPRVRLLHAGGNLYVCVSSLTDPGAVALLVGTTPDMPLAGFVVDSDGLQSQLVGDGQGLPLALTPTPGYEARASHIQDQWSAELRISDALVGGWNHAAALSVRYGAADAIETGAVWPPEATFTDAATWATAWFGTPPKPDNRAPTADAGPSQSVAVWRGTRVALAADASYDPDGDSLTYQWTQLDGDPVVLIDPTTALASFVVDGVDGPRTLRFQVVVSDGTVASSPAETTVVLTKAGDIPLSGQGSPEVDAGPDTSAHAEFEAATDAGPATPSSGGCGCRLAPTHGGCWGSLLLLILGAIVLRCPSPRGSAVLRRSTAAHRRSRGGAGRLGPADGDIRQ